MGQIFTGSAAPDFHSYNPGTADPGALTRMISEPLPEISTSTSSRDLTVHADDNDASRRPARAAIAPFTVGLTKFKQYGLMVRNPAIEINVHVLDV